MALRQRFRQFRDIRTQVRNIAGFNIGGGTFDIDLALLPKAFESPEGKEIKTMSITYTRAKQ